MAFLNIPLKSVQVLLTTSSGVESMPWNNPLLYPVIPPALPPAPVQKDFRWRVNMTVTDQNHSSYLTRAPGKYNGQDIVVGQWIANLTTGQAWQIITIESKTTTNVTAIVQDIYRYNTFRDTAQVGFGGPLTGSIYVVFDIGDTGIPEIDPVPAAGTSATFSQNLQSRFEYINLQYDYPLHQTGNAFGLNDVIAADSTTNSFVLSDATNRIVVGRVTSISDTVPGWFTINPVQKVVDFLDFLPGGVGDILYTSLVVPGAITATPGGSQIYIKLRNNTSSVSLSTAPGPTTPGNVFQLNGIDVTVGGSGTPANLQTAVNLKTPQTGVVATLTLFPSTVQTNNALITTTYGEPALFATASPATATINGTLVTFNVASTDPGYEDYARPAQMAQVINAAAISGIIADTPSALILRLTNSTGGSITIVNGTSDVNGVPVAGTNSGTGLALSTPASVFSQITFTAVDARAINFLDVVGSTVADYGLISVENGVKAAGLYIEEGLRTASNTVVANLTQLNALSPLIGDAAYVIDSDDGQGNNVGEWSMWVYNGVAWVQTSNQDSASTDAKSIEYTLTSASPATFNVGEISTGRRVTLITVEVTQAFDGTPTLEIGYIVANPVTPVTVPNGLMTLGLIDLTVTGTYTTSTDILFGTDTVEGDVTVTAALSNGGATIGMAQIIVSYV